MSVVLNKPGLAHARSLISAGKVNSQSDWSFSSEDSNPLLGAKDDDWTNYAKFHLGEDTAASEKTNDRYKYPFGKGGELYRSALIAIRQRAAQQNENDIFSAAGDLLQSIDATYKAEAPYSASVELAAAAIDPPKDILLLPKGTWKGYFDKTSGKKKSFTIADKEIDSAVAAFRTMKEKNPMRDLVIDNDHLTLKDTYAPAFGWIKDMVKAADGLHAIVDWTKLGIDAISNRLYRYISPVFGWNITDKESGKTIPFAVMSAGLTNEPFFDQLVIAKYINQSTTEELDMKNLLAKLVEAFKLTAEATEEELIAAFDAQLKTWDGFVAAKNELFTALGLKAEATLEEAKGVIMAAKNNAGSLQTVTTELAELKKNLLQDKFTAVIAKGIETGRVLPAQKADTNWLETQRAWAEKNFASFSEYFTAKAPIIGPLRAIPAGADEHLEEDPVLIAKAALEYQMSEAKLGRVITTTEAVNHVNKKGAKQ